MEIGLNKLPWYGQIAAFLVVASAGFLAFQLSWAAPLGDDMALREQELAGLRAEVARALQTSRRLGDLETEVTQLEERLESLRAALPDERAASGLLRRIQTIAAQSNLSMRGFTPQAVEVREGHAAWPIRLELNGSYHNLGVFFDRVSKFSQVITIDDVVIRAIDPPQANATISVECTATTFVLSDGMDPSETEPAI